MNEFFDGLVKVFGAIASAGSVGLAVYLALLAAKSALAVAVQQAGQREIEARKAELTKGLEDHKKGLALEIEARKTELAAQLESFKKVLTLEIEQTKAAAQRELAHELERERSAASREIERFKSELTLLSETRRQVAALKVKALLDFLRASQDFQRDAFNVAPNDRDGRARLVGQMHACFGQVREIEPLVNHELFVQLSSLVSQIHIGADRWIRGVDVDVPTRINDELKRVIGLVRTELGVSVAASTVPAQPPSGST